MSTSSVILAKEHGAGTLVLGYDSINWSAFRVVNLDSGIPGFILDRNDENIAKRFEDKPFVEGSTLGCFAVELTADEAALLRDYKKAREAEKEAQKKLHALRDIAELIQLYAAGKKPNPDSFVSVFLYGSSEQAAREALQKCKTELDACFAVLDEVFSAHPDELADDWDCWGFLDAVWRSADRDREWLAKIVAEFDIHW